MTQSSEKASKIWMFPPGEPPSEDLLAACGGSKVLAGILLRRGIDSVESCRAYLDETTYKPSHFSELPNAQKAIERLAKAIESKEKITVYGDYDVDGITGTSVLLSVLRQLDANVDFYIPNRLTEGYGLNLKAVSVLASKHRTKLIVTCDCGVSNFSEINLAKSLGVDSLVLDHHTMPEMLPPAVAVVHPKLLGEEHPLYNLPGVGVAYKVCEGLLHHFGRGEESDKLLDFVTLGMIADLVPLVKENRYLVKVGLPKLVKSERIGLQALLQQVGGKEDTDLVGFGLAPRINAVGRLSDAASAVELMTTEDPQRAQELAQQLARENARRQELCERIFAEADRRVMTTCDLDQDKGICIYDESWHHGVVGIVASRLVEKFQRPVFIGQLDKEEGLVRGSARGVEQIDLYEVLKDNEALLHKWGGHKMAAGFSFAVEKAEVAARSIVNSCNRMIGTKSLRGRVEIDAVMNAAEMDLGIVSELNRMAPFGMNNRKPVLVIEELKVSSVRPLGKEGKHSRMIFAAGENQFECVMWNSRGRTPNEGETVDLAFNAEINSYGGRDRLQLMMVDWRRHGAAAVIDEPEKSNESQSASNGKAVDNVKRAGISPAPALAMAETEAEINSQVIDSQDIDELTKSANLVKSQSLVRLTFKDLRAYAGRADVIAKAVGKLSGVFLFGEEATKISAPDLKKFEFQDRTQLKAAEHLLVWQYPPSLKNFQDLLFVTRAKTVYLVGEREDDLEPQDPAQFMKQLLGLIRFAVNQRDGQVEGDKLAALLGATKMSVALALAALKRVHWIDWFTENGIIYLDLLGSPVASVEETPEYKQLLASLAQTDKFRKWCSQCSMKELQLALIPNQIGLSGEPEVLGAEAEKLKGSPSITIDER